jgi:hypothetical protein
LEKLLFKQEIGGFKHWLEYYKSTCLSVFGVGIPSQKAVSEMLWTNTPKISLHSYGSKLGLSCPKELLERRRKKSRQVHRVSFIGKKENYNS